METSQLKVRVAASTKDWLKARAEADDRSQSYVVNKILTKAKEAADAHPNE